METVRPKIRWLTDETMVAIVEEAYKILSEIGVIVENKTATELLLAAGAKAENNRTCFTEDIITTAMQSAPSSVSLYDRDGSEAMRLGADEIHFNPGSAALHIYDIELGGIRDGLVEDLVPFHTLTDVLPHYAAQSTGVVPSDVPEDLSDRYRLFAGLICSRKPIVTGTFRTDAYPTMLEMLTVIRGSADDLRAKPLAIFDCCPSPPLKWSDLTCQCLLDCADSGQPAELVSMPLTGATSPVTLIGAIVQHCAESISGIVIHQLRKPGAPIIYGGSPAFFDMRSGTTPMGAFETMMIDGAYAQVGKYLGLPTHAYMALSDSKTVDYQAGFESSAGAVFAALSGVNNISGPGMMEFETCQSLEKLVLDHEICGYAKRVVAGIAPRDDAAVADVLREGLQAGHFMSLPHTLKWFKKEGYYPSNVVNREVVEKWEQKGKPDAFQAAHQRVEKLLADGIPNLLDTDRQKELRTIIESDAKTHGIDSLPELPI